MERIKIIGPNCLSLLIDKRLRLKRCCVNIQIVAFKIYVLVLNQNYTITRMTEIEMDVY